MSILSTKSQFHSTAQKTTKQISKLVLSSAIALTVNGLVSSPSVAYTQVEPATAQNGATTEHLLAVDESTPTVEEQIARLDAAVLTVTNNTDDFSPRNKIRMLRRMAEAYSELGEQTRAVKLLDEAVQVARDTASERRPIAPYSLATAYIDIGEITTAENLLSQVLESEDNLSTGQLISVAYAYDAAGNTDRAASTRSFAIDLLGDPSVWEGCGDWSCSPGNGLLSYVKSLAESYSQLPSSADAQPELSRLTTLLEAGIEHYGTAAEADASNSGFQLHTIERYSGRIITSMTTLAIAHSHHGNEAAAKGLLEQAMERVRTDEESGYTITEIATAYGYINDKAVVEQALSELTELAVSDLSPSDPVGPLFALGAIAATQQQIGNPELSEQAIQILLDEYGNSIYMLGGILGVYSRMDNVPAQQATIQQMFDLLPLLRTAEFNISDVTAGYSGISGLLEAYTLTADDALAQERIAMLENFFKATQFDPSGISGQLGMLAIAAGQREDYADAQRLLEEATKALEDEKAQLTERWGGAAMYRLIAGYSLLENDQVKQAGFDEIEQIANTLSPERRQEVNNAIIRARAGV